MRVLWMWKKVHPMVIKLKGFQLNHGVSTSQNKKGCMGADANEQAISGYQGIILLTPFQNPFRNLSID